MTYKFDWTHVINGQTEIEAKNGVEAEKLFREMTTEQRLSSSKLDVNSDSLKIRYVDAGLGDVHTAEEWQRDFKHIT